MLKDMDKYCFLGCLIEIGGRGPVVWQVMDWDRRRMISLVTDAEYQEDPVQVIAHFKRHIKTLPLDTYKIHMSERGDLLRVSTDPKDDPWIIIWRFEMEDLQLEKLLSGVETVIRIELCEISRLAWGIDLVSYGTGEEEKRVDFKYALIPQDSHRFWTELNVWMRLSHHPNIVPIDRIVLDEIRGQIVGFTTPYIPGGSLEDTPSQGVKLKWLKQLIQLVDALNLRYGVIHDNIIPRHLPVDPETDDLLLINFNFSRRIAGPVRLFIFDISGQEMARVILTVYIIITGEKRFQYTHDTKKISNAAAVMELEEWTPAPGMILDHPVSAYRSLLEEWTRQRRAVHVQARECIDWPEFPYKQTVWERDERGASYAVGGAYDCSRAGEREAGRAVIEWERPPEDALRDEAMVVDDDEYVYV
ncbi:hypothetical protein TGAM01_v205892 [Trichoderma gamsii]|uniref:Protein kinase domain-containing protein n=1 Tax=Trichoderma gamsii TaxID=398673 RepID=A0A2P4ZLN5_9HYPO|nr:hypothetical protein TGAM01_v205892 [Trichoderma gamsii]PON25206.1 hypothetical protein TGAM01_v205892 [Trichoderma gamsii]